MKGVFEKLDFFRTLGMQKILVGCSGGVDSMALLHICKEYSTINKIEVRAIHINHGVQSLNDEWENKVLGWCGALGINTSVVNLNMGSCSNMEENARNLRQSSVDSIIKENEWFLTAHHANDQAENMILALTRGGGHSALSGMNEISNIKNYISAKPLLSLTKDNITSFCKDNEIDHVSDPTNFESIHDRNFIRNNIIPLLESRWPNFVESANTSSLNIKNVSLIIDDMADGNSEELFLSDLSSPGYKSNEVLRSWLKKRFKKSPGNNIINSIITLSKSQDGQILNHKGFHIGIWKNTIFDLSLNRTLETPPPKFDQLKYQDQLPQSIMIGGVNKKLKKIFKKFSIKPWDKAIAPFYFLNGELISVGKHM
jgi:tRNA(Ile)-lysidine synthase